VHLQLEAGRRAEEAAGNVGEFEKTCPYGQKQTRVKKEARKHMEMAKLESNKEFDQVKEF